MITTILSDFSRVILYPKDSTYTGTLNGLHTEQTKKDPGYNFFDHFAFNKDLLDFYQSLKDHYSVNIFTTGTIQNHPKVQEKIAPVFNAIYTAADYGLSKTDPKAYLFICDKLTVQPEETLFIDDQVDNLEAAKKAGLNTIQFLTNDQVIAEIQKLLVI